MDKENVNVEQRVLHPMNGIAMLIILILASIASVLGFIIGTTPLDQYDSFRDTLISMGIEECIELTPAALDRYNAR